MIYQIICAFLFSNVALILSIAAEPGNSIAPEFTVVGYLPDYRLPTVNEEEIDGLTDLVFFSVTPASNGTLPQEPISTSAIAKLKKLRGASPKRVLLTVGGWGKSDGFPSAAVDLESRSKLIAQLARLCKQHEFAGVDYDWEHPKGASELAAYASLLKETKAAFRSNGLLVTVAQAPWQDLGREAYAAVDRVHLMAYDHEFPQATFAKVKADVQRLVAWGCPPEKIVLGIPFYGRNAKGEARTYAELVENSEPFDRELDLIEGFALNSKVTVQRKVQYARQQGLSGVMIWEIAQDAKGEEKSLVHAILEQRN